MAPINDAVLFDLRESAHGHLSSTTEGIAAGGAVTAKEVGRGPHRGGRLELG
ncbi:hypothetical protein [Actinomadura sp. KC216]|uniref:hypothetical protein n=1 Tax=Actinomadura sp. KC216 TaxID=2530370 RepID=UPI001404B6B9|nr:hypothetical protein [Actinomadura sp. KC216]